MSRVIDPFAGLSTTLVEAKIHGVKSVGFEAHPFFYDLSQAKLDPAIDFEVIQEIENLLINQKPFKGKLSNIWSESAITYLSKLIPEPSLRILASALLTEDSLPDANRNIYRLIVSRVLEFVSGSKTDGVYKAPTSIKRSIPYADAVYRVTTLIKEDLVPTSPYQTESRLYFGNSENMAQVRANSCDLCVTSPPYLNNFDYAEMTRMELYFWRYAGSWSEITAKVRRNLVVNTTTTPTDRKDKGGYIHNLPITIDTELRKLVVSLKEKQQMKLGKKDYHTLVYPYFSQMQNIIRELKRVLKSGSLAHWVVGDSALYGVHIETHNILAKIMQESGFEVVSIESLRRRGERSILSKREGAKNGLGEFDIIVRKI